MSVCLSVCMYVSVCVVMSICVAPIHETSLRRSGIACIVKGYHSFTCTPKRFIRKRNEPYLPLPSQPQLVLFYRPRRDGRLSRPWCKVAPARFESATSRLQIWHSTTQPLNINIVQLFIMTVTRAWVATICIEEY